jgi:DNA invertase Pin-like site-specific DNA recombinase
MMNYQEAQKILENQDAAKAVIQQYKKLETVHEQFGFKNRRDFIQALQELDSGTSKRGRLTPDDRKRVEAAIKEGRPASQIAREFGISQPYVYTLKAAIKGKKK